MDLNNINRDRDTSGLGPIEYDQTKVPALIRKHADNVRTKTYGQEVREAQARNAEVAGLIASESVDISNETKERQDIVETQFNSVQQELTDKDPISAPEIIAARNGEATLSERLDKEQQEVTEQLAQTVIPITRFGADPTGVQDSHNAFVATLAYLSGKSGVLAVPQGSFRITKDEPISIPSNVTLEFVGSVSYEPERTKPLFEAIGTRNIKIINAKIDGGFMGGTHSESALAICLRSVDNVSILNPNLRNIRGDGIYIGRDYTQGANPPIPKNIFIENAVMFNTKRNGLAMTSGENIIINGLRVDSDTNETWNISAGFDMETNNTTEQFKNIVVRDVNMRLTAGTAFRSLIGSGKTPNIFDNITFENVHIEMLTPLKLAFVWDGGGVAKSLKINNITVVNGGIQIYNTGKVDISNVLVKDAPESSLLFSYLKGALTLTNFEGNSINDFVTLVLLTSTSSSVVLSNLRLEGFPTRASALTVSGNLTLKNVRIKDSLINGGIFVQRTENIIITETVANSIDTTNQNTRVIRKNNIVSEVVE